MKKQRAALKMDLDAPIAEKNVNMSNALTRAAHSLLLAEKRLISACISKIDSLPAGVPLVRDGAWTVRLSAAEYAETFDVDLDTAYTQLRDASEKLFNRYVRTMRETRKGPEEHKFRWVGGVTYQKGEGWVELQWWHEVVPHLYGLRKEFTSYKLKQAAALRSAYSWRLFECFQSWKDTGRYIATIEDFHRAMDVPQSCVADFKALRVRVIEPAVKELTEKNGLEIEWEVRRAGRKVIGLDFKFRPNPQTALF
ncbi:replication initiation protein [Burkholderia vietnamiensis]|uniref:replication initiation protein n=1 Tax=Burkholderia vietnamiensis TaxID=60552 RepID=UPI001B9F3779|nr:replication initiation protein [Burkholderia vietnamiensis]MBR8055681.1 replication initiation protein [Burkholderia vietnamiensis]HDR8929222.1 replication initiation protein [Burkholderia vietnamiensis]HDR9359284.1 replication initiation protein [Burkholderia vietnamiensis]